MDMENTRNFLLQDSVTLSDAAFSAGKRFIVREPCQVATCELRIAVLSRHFSLRRSATGFYTVSFWGAGDGGGGSVFFIADLFFGRRARVCLRASGLCCNVHCIKVEVYHADPVSKFMNLRFEKANQNLFCVPSCK